MGQSKAVYVDDRSKSKVTIPSLISHHDEYLTDVTRRSSLAPAFAFHRRKVSCAMGAVGKQTIVMTGLIVEGHCQHGHPVSIGCLESESEAGSGAKGQRKVNLIL